MFFSGLLITSVSFRVYQMRPSRPWGGRTIADAYQSLRVLDKERAPPCGVWRQAEDVDRDSFAVDQELTNLECRGFFVDDNKTLVSVLTADVSSTNCDHNFVLVCKTTFN